MSDTVQIEARINIFDFMPASHIPLMVRVRRELNKQGIRFEDDGFLSEITNENPIPLGVVRSHIDYSEPHIVIYSQTLKRSQT